MLSFYLSLIDDYSQKRSFEEIYNKYHKQMLYVANQILHSQFDAEDVVHDTFLEVATKHMEFIQSIKDPIHIRNYLLKATKNRALNLINKNKRTNDLISNLADIDYDEISVASDDDFVKELCDKSEYDTVITAISSMNEKSRDLLYYRFVMELTIPQIAKILNQNVEATKKQVQRSKQALIKILNQK